MSRLEENSYSFENVSYMREVERFYRDIFTGIFGERSNMTEEEILKSEKEMEKFELAYELAKNHSPQKFENIQEQIRNQISLLSQTDKGFGKKQKELKNIIDQMLQEVHSYLKKDGKLHILDKVFSPENNKSPWMNFNFNNGVNRERKENKEKIRNVFKINTILESSGFRNAQNKTEYLSNYDLSLKRGVEKYYEKIKNKCFPNETQENSDDIAKKMQMFNLAYALSKYKFQNVERSSGERYFDHLLAVIDLYLDTEEQPTFEGVMIALLHDIIEDSDIDSDTLEHLFGPEIANGVSSLSKPSVFDYLESVTEKENFSNWKEKGILNDDYQISDSFQNRKDLGKLNKEEQEIYKHYKDIHKKYKNKRNTKYFEGFLERGLRDNLSLKDKTNIRIKMYDRIHNIITLDGFGIKKIDTILRKINETIIYFLPITQKHFPDLHEILIKKLEKACEWLLRETSGMNQNKTERNKRKNLRKKIRILQGTLRSLKTFNKQTSDILKSE